MAAATRQKAGAKADIDKDLHSLMELQEKLSMHSGLQQMVMQQMQKTKMSRRRTELTLEEIKDLPTEVAVYKQVGKAYLMAPMQQVRDDLKDDISSLDEELKRLTQQQQHAAKALAATEAEVQELFKSSPGLTRQLLPAS